MAQITIDTVLGQARVGAATVAVADAGVRGELRIGGADGAVLRPLTFGERTRLVTRAVAAARPQDSLCASVLQLATVTPGTADTPLLEILALHLAGAGLAAPPFAEAALLVARGTGWDLAQLLDAEAAEVDRLASALAPPVADTGWTRLVFSAGTGDGLDALRTELADDLLRRGTGTPRAAQATLLAQHATSAYTPAALSITTRAAPQDTAAVITPAMPHGSDAAVSAARARAAASGDSIRTAMHPAELIVRLPRQRTAPDLANDAARAQRDTALLQTGIRFALPGAAPASAVALSYPPPSTDSLTGIPGQRHTPVPAWLPEGRADVAPGVSAAEAGFSSADPWDELTARPAANTGAAPAVPPHSRADTPLLASDEADSLADALAARLHDEADLRGLDR